MLITMDTIIMAGSFVAAAVAICRAVGKIITWMQNQNKQDEQISEMQQEQCMIVYAMLACLDGLKQKGCNGEVTKAHAKLSKHINKQAHHIDA